MRQPLVITISHRLGRAEVKRRLDARLAEIRDQLAALSSAIEYGWADYRLDFTVVAMRQNIKGHIDIAEEWVRIEIALPLLLGMLADRITGRVRDGAARLLDGPGQR